MSSSTLIFLLFVIGLPLAMMFMHRGGHAHGGMGGGGHGGNHRDETERAPDAAGEEEEKKPLLGPPGTASSAPAPVPAKGQRHRLLKRTANPGGSRANPAGADARPCCECSPRQPSWDDDRLLHPDARDRTLAATGVVGVRFIALPCTAMMALMMRDMSHRGGGRK